MSVPVRCTLVDLVQSVAQVTDSDREVVAAVTHLINSGRVVLCGNFAGARIEIPPGHEVELQRARGRFWPLPRSTAGSMAAIGAPGTSATAGGAAAPVRG